MYVVTGLLIAFVMGATAWQISGTAPGVGLFDFEAFHLVGELTLDGNAVAAHTPEAFLEAQKELPRYSGGYFQWAYPPLYDMVSGILALFPPWLAYLLFEGATLAAFLWVLRRLAGPHFGFVLLCVLPVILLTLRTGQNAFLTAFLIGMTCLLTLRGTAKAGVPLGFMALKPHLALGIGLGLLLKGRWAAAAISVALALGLYGLSYVVLGAEAWAAFFDTAKRTSASLFRGDHFWYRQTSIASTALSLGAAPKLAMALHLTGLAGAVAGLVALAIRGVPLASFLGFSVITSAMVSPYGYDYDLAMLGVAAALLAAPLATRITSIERVIFLYGFWVLYASGLVVAIMTADANQADIVQRPSVNGFVLAMMAAMVFARLFKIGPERREN